MGERSAQDLSTQPPLGSLFTTTIQSLSLSPQQAKIVALIMEGKKDETIAFELGLSKHTVRDYLNKRIFPRLEVANRVELILKIAALRCSECPHDRCPRK